MQFSVISSLSVIETSYETRSQNMGDMEGDVFSFSHFYTTTQLSASSCTRTKKKREAQSTKQKGQLGYACFQMKRAAQKAENIAKTREQGMPLLGWLARPKQNKDTMPPTANSVFRKQNGNLFFFSVEFDSETRKNCQFVFCLYF